MTPLLVLTPFDPDGRATDPSGTLATLAPALTRAGRAVAIADLDRLRLGRGRLEAGAAAGGWIEIDAFAQTLLLGFGDRSTTLDRFQLLAATTTRFVTHPLALLRAHSKIDLRTFDSPWPVPEYLVGRACDLADLVAPRAAEGWIVKPTAASFGAGVERLPDHPAPLQARLRASAATSIVQRRVAGRERRLLFAAGRFIGQYGREPVDSHDCESLPTNLATGARAVRWPLARTDQARVAALGAKLAARGLGWVGVDLKGEHLLELNVANPGGLATLTALARGAESPADDACAAFASLLDPR